MRASDVSVSGMKSASDCYKAIDEIWMDCANCLGGIKAFTSGRQTYLTETAKRKLEALERKAISFPDIEE